MKLLKFSSLLLLSGVLFSMISCTAEVTDNTDSEGGAEDAIMTTAAFIEEAKGMTRDEFDEKYPRGSEIELKGEVRAPATWSDKVVAKFGTGLNDLPLSANFMFEANGGSKEATKEKVEIAKEVHFKGTVEGAYFDGDKFVRCSFVDCVAQ